MSARRVLDGGLRGDRRGRDRGRLPVLRRLPDDAVHRGARAHSPSACPRSAACASTPRASSKRSAWRGARCGHRRARRDRLDRPGPLADAGVVLRDHARRAAARRLQHGARPERLLPGDARRRPRRLPPHRARAAWTSPRRSSSRSSRSTSPTSGATRCSSTATTASRTSTRGGRRRSRRRFPTLPAEGLGARRVARRQRRVAHRLAARARQAARRRRASSEHLRGCMAEKIAAIAAAEVRVETGFIDDAETVVVAFGTPAQVRARTSCDSCAPRACRSATSGRSRCGRSRTTAVAEAAARVRTGRACSS